MTHSFPTRRSSDRVLEDGQSQGVAVDDGTIAAGIVVVAAEGDGGRAGDAADMDVEAGLGGLRLAGDVAFRIDLGGGRRDMHREVVAVVDRQLHADEFGEVDVVTGRLAAVAGRSEEHTSELQS